MAINEDQLSCKIKQIKLELNNIIENRFYLDNNLCSLETTAGFLINRIAKLELENEEFKKGCTCQRQ